MRSFPQRDVRGDLVALPFAGHVVDDDDVVGHHIHHGRLERGLGDGVPGRCHPAGRPCARARSRDVLHGGNGLVTRPCSKRTARCRALPCPEARPGAHRPRRNRTASLDEDNWDAQLLLKGRPNPPFGALLRLAGVDDDLGRGGGHGLAVQGRLGAEHRAEHRVVGELSNRRSSAGRR